MYERNLLVRALKELQSAHQTAHDPNSTDLEQAQRDFRRLGDTTRAMSVPKIQVVELDDGMVVVFIR